ncbi:class I SAM-dependent methyltransferase [Actibacterium pelagium]|uniref:Methyltransferase domain-containing protein n=1 Tax=Actibacterium pelagium TaxID=2029103 RepID=A0A917AHM5_9RHOB|nr:class I SAM-dependent methyltransferase [Actibacterium pelagium]GGE49183.1 hypothetical protein GCM10011517_16280 [Actibacterium pelagium]
MTDRKTLDVYAGQAGRYAQKFATDTDKPKPTFDKFIRYIPEGGHVLDWGCGPGHWAARFAKAGFTVEATDASPEMAALARDKFGVEVRIEPFAALSAENQFDAIWAHFSLLHAPRADFPGHLDQIARALKPEGHVLLGLKLGSGEQRDKLGRFYSFYEETELRSLLADAGLKILHSHTGSEVGLSGEVSSFIIIIAQAVAEGDTL